MIAFILTTTTNDGTKSTLGGIIIGCLLGIGLVYLLGWGIMALLGRKFVLKAGWLILAVFMGIIGAVTGDITAAEKRPLTLPEENRAKLMFGNTINYKKVRVATNTRLMNIRSSKAPFNTIYLSKKASAIAPFQGQLNLNYEDIYIHELTHVWQTQHGIGIFKKMKIAIWVFFSPKKPYKYGESVGLNRAISEKQGFRAFNTEQQGAIIADYFCSAHHKRRQHHNQLEHFARQVRYNNGYHIEVDTFPVMGIF
jgi:hypothetical protein